MANGICVFAEHDGTHLAPIVLELVTAANEIKTTTKEPVQALVVAQDCAPLIEQLHTLGVDDIYGVNTNEDCLFQDDSVSCVLSDMLSEINPSTVLVPATISGRSLFSRVAVKLGCGMTADCTELKVDTREDGSYFIHQNKPSYGENVFVTIVTREAFFPQMLTVRPGVYTAVSQNAAQKTSVHMMSHIVPPPSKIRVIEEKEATTDTNSILSAEIVVVGGRGAEDPEHFSVLKAFAEKLGASIGGTRPLADTGQIPFENQIGQTGFTIRPKICVSLGVSGAIQHTEGLKDIPLLIAINTDENAPIFNIAQYGIVADFKGIIKECIDCV